MNLVVGSGPAAVGAALALLERGASVTMLDVGRELEPEFAATQRSLGSLPYESWPADEYTRLARLTGPTSKGFPMKTVFGSDFAYRGAPDLMPVDVHGADILVSLARGGLSNVWGSNVLSFCDDDWTGWPVGPDEMAPAYRAVLRHVPLSATADDELAGVFPLHTDRLEPRLLSRQSTRLLSDLAARREAVHARGVRFGPSRLGLRTSASDHDPGCVRCGLCLHGCPYDLIYSSGQTLRAMMNDPRFRYEKGLYVTRFRETTTGVELDATRVADGSAVRFSGARAFLGCGAYSTARLVLESLERFGVEVQMLESQYVLLPMLHAHRFPDAPNERLQTLSQVCLRLRDPEVSPRDVHMLVYSYGPLYRAMVDASPLRFAPPLARALLERLLTLQGYLHSDVSARLALSVRRNPGGPAVLSVEGRPNPETRPTLRRLEARLRGLGPFMRARPIPFAMKVAEPGKSYHTGGTFPMRRDPRTLDSDLLGRPLGLSRVHVVDASVFPSVPATNLTLTVMANAYRIASESHALSPADAAGATA